MDWQNYFSRTISGFKNASNNPFGWVTDLLGLTHNRENAANLESTYANMLYNSEEAEKNRIFQERMWNMNNEYNSPAAQMQRAREAGLNPGLLYGQPISEAQAPAGSEASAGAGHGVIPNEDVARMLGQWSLIPEQKELMAAQAEEIRSRIPVNNQKVLNMVQDLAESKSRVELNGSKIANMDADTLIKAREEAIAFIKEQFENEAYQYRMTELKATAEQKRIASVFAERMALADLGVKYSAASLNDALKDYHVQVTPKQVALLDELAELYHQQHTTAQDYREFFDKHKEEDRFLRILFQALTSANDAAGTVMDGYELKNGKTVKVTKL